MEQKSSKRPVIIIVSVLVVFFLIGAIATADTVGEALMNIISCLVDVLLFYVFIRIIMRAIKKTAKKEGSVHEDAVLDIDLEAKFEDLDPSLVAEVSDLHVTEFVKTYLLRLAQEHELNSLDEVLALDELPEPILKSVQHSQKRDIYAQQMVFESDMPEGAEDMDDFSSDSGLVEEDDLYDPEAYMDQVSEPSFDAPVQVNGKALRLGHKKKDKNPFEL